MTKIQWAAGQNELKALVKFKTVGSQAIVRTMVCQLSAYSAERCYVVSVNLRGVQSEIKNKDYR